MSILPAPLIAALAFSAFALSQDCEALKFASAADAVNYLDVRQDPTAECVNAAFQLIQRLPQEDAIPILIKHLGYKRPHTGAENLGFYIHGPLPWLLYPAVEALYSVGLPAEPALIDGISRIEDNDSIDRANALYALILIHHSSILPLIRTMHQRSLSLRGTPSHDRLESAILELKGRYCYGKLKQECEKALASTVPN